ncbi:MAG: hypothetical protein LBQ88_23110 [Treponema sp.]|jgi:hypothetical protein|nr:hypothetical protein [Treponema sp.]
MNNGELHTLISLPDFKSILTIDDREDCLDFTSAQNPGHEFLHGKNSANSFQPPSLAAFCLVTATFTIEQYCKRWLVLKRHIERIEVYADLLLPLREYPVREVLTVYALGGRDGAGEIIEPDSYQVVPDLEGGEGCDPCGAIEDTVYSLSLSPAYRRGTSLAGIKAVYRAGYGCEEAGPPCGAPADLASACLELAAWNMARYRGRRIGLTGAMRGKGQDGEHLELSMPENVRVLLEPYRRRII